MDEMVTPQAEEMITFLSGWIERNFDQRMWENHPQLRQMRRLSGWYARSVITILNAKGSAALVDDLTLRKQVQLATTWLDTIAFRDDNEPADVLGTYGTVAGYYAAILGEDAIVAKAQQANYPEPGEVDHLQRIGGLPQVGIDMPWIKMSSGYWASRIMGLVGKDEAVSKEQVTTLLALLDGALEQGEVHDLQASYIDHQAHLGHVVAALLLEDEARLRELLRFTKEKNDKRLRDDTAMWIGNTAPKLSMKWWNTVIDAWRDELDYKPKYYWIAWRAALSDAPEQALAMAAAAAERFSDDPAFVQEHRFMQELFAQQEAAEAAKAAPEQEKPAETVTP
jgi:hypothetical protein